MVAGSILRKRALNITEKMSDRRTKANQKEMEYPQFAGAGAQTLPGFGAEPQQKTAVFSRYLEGERKE